MKTQFLRWIKVVLGLGFSAFCSCISTSYNSPVSSFRFADLTIHLAIDPPKVLNHDILPDAQGWTTFAISETETLKVRALLNLDAEAAKRLLSFKAQNIYALYQPETDPYFGTMDATGKCRTEVDISPSIQKDSLSDSLVFNLLATRDFIYGTCTESQEVYRSQYLVVYCRQAKAVYEVKYFFPRTHTKVNRVIASCSAK